MEDVLTLQTAVKRPMIDIGKGIKVGVINITPDQATKMLSSNGANRAIKKGKISQYAIDMEGGMWQLNGVPIILSKTGQLLDGQNRLYAIKRSGVSQEILVVWGISAEAFKTIDTGANRTGKDVLTIIGIPPEKAGRLTSLVQKIYNSNAGRNFVWTGSAVSSSTEWAKSRQKLTNQGILQFYQDNQRELDEVYSFCVKYEKNAKKVLSFPVYLLIYYRLRKIHIYDAQEFCRQLATGEMLASDNPIYALREKFIQLKNSDTEKVPSWHYPALTFKAWNYYRKRKPLVRLFISSSETEPIKPI